MVQPYNTPDELQERLRFLGPNQDQFNLAERLQDATLELDTIVGRTVEEQLRADNEDQRRFRFAFSNVVQVTDVEIVSPSFGFEQELDDNKYTVTQKPDRGNPNIVFDKSFAEDNLFRTDYKLTVEYIPELFKRLELRLAELDITRLASIQTGDDQVAAQAEKAQERVGQIQQNINRTTANITNKDRGDTLVSNTRFPGHDP